MNILEIEKLKLVQAACKDCLNIVAPIQQRQNAQFNYMNVDRDEEEIIRVNAELLAVANTLKNCLQKCVDLKF